MPRDLVGRLSFLSSCKTQTGKNLDPLLAKQLFFNHLSFAHYRVSFTCHLGPATSLRRLVWNLDIS